MSDYLPKFNQGAPFTVPVSADVTGGRVVAVSGAGTAAHAGADSASAFGVAAVDTLSGESVTVFPLKGTVHKLVASGAIAAGARVITAAAGKVATIGGGSNPIGVALTASAVDGDVLEVIC